MKAGKCEKCCLSSFVGFESINVVQSLRNESLAVGQYLEITTRYTAKKFHVVKAQMGHELSKIFYDAKATNGRFSNGAFGAIIQETYAGPKQRRDEMHFFPRKLGLTKLPRYPLEEAKASWRHPLRNRNLNVKSGALLKRIMRTLEPPIPPIFYLAPVC